ncbi:MAG: HAMP domain-containing sensor histidine kinase [Kofleriaceae bacterium]
MKVRTRLVLFGAVVPVVALAVAALIGGTVLERRLRAEVDAHLLAQAAVESVGLFDAPDEEVHLHAHVSPLATDLHDVIPDGAVYLPTGARVMATRDDAAVPATLAWDRPIDAVTVQTADRGAGAMRELIVAVEAPSGKRYTLYLAVPMARVALPMRSYWRAVAIGTGGVTLVLLAVQVLVAARLAGRIRRLRAYLPRLRDGQSEPAPPPDAAGDELAELRDGLYHAARTLEERRALDARWVAGAAHDLRTPLGVIRTTVDLALRKPRGLDELHGSLRRIGAEVERLRGLTDALLVARDGPRQRLRVDLREVADAATTALAPAAEAAGVTLVVRGGAAPITGDATALRRVFDNLIHNAIAHAPIGTEVEIEVAASAKRRRITVRDRGVGIDEAERERVFVPFERGAASAGAGLGLAIVRQIASEHGGEAYVDPGPHPGAALVVDLPASAEA